jgi:hypothetical protein
MTILPAAGALVDAPSFPVPQAISGEPAEV